MKKTDQSYIDMPKIIIFQKKLVQKNASTRAELHLKFSDQLLEALKGQSHEKVGEMSVWGISLGPN
jgi:hypothetical protein